MVEPVAPVALPPEAWAVSLTDGRAAADGNTVKVIAGAEPPAAMTPPVVHVTVCRLAPHAHDVPDALTKLKPVFKVSVTVIVPAVAAAPLLPTTIVYAPCCPTVKFPAVVKETDNAVTVDGAGLAQAVVATPNSGANTSNRADRPATARLTFVPIRTPSPQIADYAGMAQPA